MASLFNNENALLLRVLCRVLNEVHNGRRLTRQEMAARLSQAFPGGEFFATEAEEELIDLLFPTTYDGTDFLRPFYDAPVPSLPTLDERRWLRTMLTDEAAAFLLPGALREKLLSRLSNASVTPVAELWEKRQGKGDNPAREPLKTRLALLWRALREKKQVHYVNVDRAGIRHDNTLSPCRLSYDAAGNRYYFIFWNDEERRAIRVNPRRLRAFELTRRPIPPDTEEKYQAFLGTRDAAVTFRLIEREESSAFDRCFSLFAAYDKESFAEEDNTYTITVHYKNFDRREIIAHLLSLAPNAIVLEPADIRAEIVTRLKQAWTFYRDP